MILMALPVIPVAVKFLAPIVGGIGAELVKGHFDNKKANAEVKKAAVDAIPKVAAVGIVGFIAKQIRDVVIDAKEFEVNGKKGGAAFNIKGKR